MSGGLFSAQLTSEEVPCPVTGNAVMAESYGEEHIHEGLCYLPSMPTAGKKKGRSYATAYSGEAGDNAVSYQQV